MDRTFFSQFIVFFFFYVFSRFEVRSIYLTCGFTEFWARFWCCNTAPQNHIWQKPFLTFFCCYLHSDVCRLQDCWCPPGLQRGGDPLCEGRLPLAGRGGGGGAGRHRDVEQQHRRQRGNAAGAMLQCLWFTISGLLLVVALYQNTGNTACHLGNSAQLPSLSGFLPRAAGGRPGIWAAAYALARVEMRTNNSIKMQSSPLLPIINISGLRWECLT